MKSSTPRAAYSSNWAQFFLVDGQTNVALQDRETISISGARRRSQAIVRLEPFARVAAALVSAEGGEQHRVAGEIRELNGRHRATAGRIAPAAAGVNDLALRRHARNAQEIDPLDMTDDSETHDAEPTG